MKTSQLTMSQIVELTGGKRGVPWPPDEPVISRVGSVPHAGPDTLVFAESDAVLSEALVSPAGVILASEQLQAPQEPRLVYVRDARFAFALCARALVLASSVGEVSWIDPSASVSGKAILGKRVHVAAGAVIGADAVLGDDCSIGERAVIAEGVRLGNRVVVQAGAVLGSKGFGYVRDPSSGEYILFPQVGALAIEDDVEIGANSTVDRGALEETRIGRGTKIDNLVHIGHNCRIGQNVIIAAQVGISGSCVVEDGAILAGQVGISDHCHIGPGVVLGGQAGVYRGKHVVGPGEIFAGTPAEPLREQMKSLAQMRKLARQRRK